MLFDAPSIHLQHLLDSIQLLHTTLGDRAWRTMHKFVHDNLEFGFHLHRITPLSSNMPFIAKVQHTDQDACKSSTQKWQDTQCCDEKGSSALLGSTGDCNVPEAKSTPCSELISNESMEIWTSLGLPFDKASCPPQMSSCPFMFIHIHLDTTSNSSVVGFWWRNKSFHSRSTNRPGNVARTVTLPSAKEGQKLVCTGTSFTSTDSTAVCKQFAMRFQDMICQENVYIRSNGFQRSKVKCKHFNTFYLPRKPWKKVESQILSWNKNHQVVCGDLPCRCTFTMQF